MATPLSPHFTLEELTHSDTAVAHGINNAPAAGTPERAALQKLAEFLEKVRHICGDKPMSIHVAYRNPQVNALVGGVPDSAHMKGFACDFDIPGQTPFQTAQILDKAGHAGTLEFDQLILEQLPDPSWVHIGRRNKTEATAPRMERLTKAADGSYLPGILAH